MSIPANQISSSTAAYPGVTTAVTHRSWFSRNWRWLVPTFLIVFVILPILLIASIFAAMKNSDAAKESVLRAQRNALVVEQLGTPIEEGWMVSGSISTSTTSGDADLAVPISGPKGRGKIFVTARKSAGAWEYQVMLAAIEGSDHRIDLLSEDSGRTSAQRRPEPSEQPASGTLPAASQPVTPASQPADPPTSSAATAPSAPEQAGVIQTQETNTGGLIGELTECRRHEGVLTIKLRFRNTTNKRADLHLTAWNNGGDFEKFYVTAGSKKFFILKDTENTYLSSLSASNGVSLALESGQTSLWWAKYPAPSPDVKKIDFITPVAPPFEDVPITDK